MPNYFYFDQNGQRQGPIDDQQLQELVAQGIIKPESPLETEEGQQIVAGLISGLAFPEATPSESRPDEANPFTGSVIQDVPVPKVSKLKNLAIRIGIVGVALLLLLGGALWVSPTLRFILIYGTDVKAVDEEGLTLLHQAAAYNKNVGVAKFLISKGADVNAKDNDGWTPLHRTAWSSSNIEILKFLISEGADVDARTKDGETPLHRTAWGGNDLNVEIRKFLISHGADINAKDNKGRTPLHMAALFMSTDRNSTVEFAKFLISHGADINARDNEGRTPLDYAKAVGNTAVVNFLSEL